MRRRAILLNALSATFVVSVAVACSGHGGGSPTPTPTPTPTIAPLTFNVPGFQVPPLGAPINECYVVNTTAGGPAVVGYKLTNQSAPAGNTPIRNLWVFTSPNGDPDGAEPCPNLNPSWRLRWATGRGDAPAFTYPTGVGANVGSKVTWLFWVRDENDTASAITDASKIEIDYAQPGSATLTSAGMFIAGTINISIPPGSTNAQNSGSCTLSADATVFSLEPELDRLGTRVQIDSVKSGVTSSLLDEPWNGDLEAAVTPAGGSLALHSGDAINTTCTYNNSSGPTMNDNVVFGLGSNNAQCFDFVSYFPATSGPQYCGIP